MSRGRGARLLAVPIGCAGAGALRASFAAEPSSRRFYLLTGQVALTWLAGSAAMDGGLPRRRLRTARTTVPAAAAIGVAAFGVFFVGGRLAGRIPALREALAHVLRYAEHESPLVLATTLVNGVAEEVFFRGALYDVAGKRPVLVSTTGYVLVTSATGNPSLVLASVVMGTLFGLQRKYTGGIVASLVTHLVWSSLMVSFPPS